MTAAQRRFSAVIGRYGEPITVDGEEFVGIAVLLSPGQARLYLSDTDLESITARPMFTVYLAHDAAIEAGDPVTWSRGSGEIRRCVELKARGQTVGKLAVVA